jgi:hypothetical protein
MLNGFLVIIAWCILRLQMEVKHSQTADKGWFPILGLGMGLLTPHHKIVCYEMSQRALDLDRFCGMTYAKENGHEICHMDCKESI